MEEQKQLKKMEIISRNGRITKKKRRKQLHNPQSHTLFPLLLAATLSKSRKNQVLMKKCLNQTILSVPHLLFAPVLSFVAALLKSNCVEIVCKSAEIVGADSLSLFEMNEKVAGDDEIIKSLISLLGSSMREISMVACNAMLDLATASVGCQRLLQFSSIEKHIWEGFMHIAVYSWYEKQKMLRCMSLDSMPPNLLVVSVKLLHVVIILIGNRDPMYRKVYLVGASSFSSLTKDMFNNWRTIFGFLVNRILTESKFSDILKHIEAAIKQNEDPLGHLRWMRHLAVEEEIEN